MRLHKSPISELCTELDARAEEFRHRPLTGKYAYLWLDALYEKVRIDGSVVSNAVVIAYGVSERGHRTVLRSTSSTRKAKRLDKFVARPSQTWSGGYEACDQRCARGPSGRYFGGDARRGMATLHRSILVAMSWLTFRRGRKLEVAASLRTVFTQVSPEGAQRAAAEFRAMFAKLTKGIQQVATALAMFCHYEIVRSAGREGSALMAELNPEWFAAAELAALLEGLVHYDPSYRGRAAAIDELMPSGRKAWKTVADRRETRTRRKAKSKINSDGPAVDQRLSSSIAT